MEIIVLEKDSKKAFNLLQNNEEIDCDNYAWVTEYKLKIPDTEDHKDTWNDIMILFESENIGIL